MKIWMALSLIVLQVDCSYIALNKLHPGTNFFPGPKMWFQYIKQTLFQHTLHVNKSQHIPSIFCQLEWQSARLLLITTKIFNPILSQPIPEETKLYYLMFGFPGLYQNISSVSQSEVHRIVARILLQECQISQKLQSYLRPVNQYGIQYNRQVFLKFIAHQSFFFSITFFHFMFGDTSWQRDVSCPTDMLRLRCSTKLNKEYRFCNSYPVFNYFSIENMLNFEILLHILFNTALIFISL